MIKAVTRKFNMDSVDDDAGTISYWMSKSSEERMEAMGYLHKQMIIIQVYDEMPRIQKVSKKVSNIGKQ